MKIYTDGSTSNNGKVNAKGGIGIYFGEDDTRNVSRRLDSSLLQTNNVSELIAIETAINILIHTEDIEKNNFIIYTDSDYSLKSITVWVNNWKKNGWKTSKKEPVKNKEIIERITESVKKFRNLSFVHVRAHTGKTDEDSIGNYYADLLANNSLLN